MLKSTLYKCRLPGNILALPNLGKRLPSPVSHTMLANDIILPRAASQTPAAALRLLAVPMYCQRRHALPQARYAISLAALSPPKTHS